MATASTEIRGESREQEAKRRAREVEGAHIQALMLEARQAGRGPDAEDAARKAEVERARAYVLGVASGVQEVGTRLSFNFWVEEGALTLVGYLAEDEEGRPGRPVEGEELSRVLRLILADYMGRHTGEVLLTLRREEARWSVDYAATGRSPRPREAKSLPVRARGTSSDTFLALHGATKGWLRTVQVPPGGAQRVEYAVRLEDGRLAEWELLGLHRMRQGRGGRPLPLSSEAEARVTRVLLPFTEGLERRTVRLVLQAEHRPGEPEARGWVASAQVERELSSPGVSWYHALHEATLLRWREGVIEGSAWLAQKGAEELAVWFAVGMARGLGSLIPKRLPAVSAALGRGSEQAAGWLRSTLIRLPGEKKRAFEQLWRKVFLEGEKALSRSERRELRVLMEGLEQVVRQPLDNKQKSILRGEARRYYKRLHPQFEKLLDTRGDLPIHHRCPLEHAHLFPDADINAADNLVMLRQSVHERVNFLWTRFRTAHRAPTAKNVEEMARIIDRHFEAHWYNRIDIPADEASLLAAAEETALREMQRLALLP